MFWRRWSWTIELKGAAPFWVAALVFLLVGVVLIVVGVEEEEALLYAGIPCALLGLLLLAMLIYSLYLKLGQPENYAVWLWWVNFGGGMAGALLFAIPSTLAAPILLVLEEDEMLWIGALFSAVGLAVSAGVALLARRQLRDRPRWTRKGKDPPGGRGGRDRGPSPAPHRPQQDTGDDGAARVERDAGHL
jgi:hypothetical protein